MATKKIKRFQEGGMSDKDRGLEASKDDKVGFFERLRMGNIDEEGSEAYKRFGAGRGRAESVPVEDRAPSPVIREAAKPMPAAMDPMEEANAREPISVPAGPRADMRPGGRPSVNVALPAKSSPAKSPAMQDQAYTRRGGATAEDRESFPRVAPASNPNYSNEGRGREMTKKQQIEREIDSIKPTAEQTQKGLESAMLPGVGLKTLSAAAKKLATRKPPKLKNYEQPASPGPATKSLPSPTKQTGYDKAGAVAKRRADRASKRRDEMLEENAKNYGLDPKAPGYEAASGAVRKEMGGKDFTFKKGGKVKPTMKKMSSGGSTSPASKRADGIATRGKTRCKIC